MKIHAVFIIFRTLPTTNADQGLELERCYKCGQVYNKLLDLWYKFVVPKGFVNAGLAIVMSAYVSIRHTELPPLLYAYFPYSTVVVAVVAFGLCYDGILIIRASEETLGRLKFLDSENVMALSRADRLAVIRRVKALRPAYFSVGDFTGFNMGVPIGVWDEIINQLVFLLTL